MILIAPSGIGSGKPTCLMISSSVTPCMSQQSVGAVLSVRLLVGKLLGLKVKLGDSLGTPDSAAEGDALSQIGSQGIYSIKTRQKMKNFQNYNKHDKINQ